jgi:hypothetical protein
LSWSQFKFKFKIKIKTKPTMVLTRAKLAIAIASALAPSSLAQIFTVNCAPLTFYRGDPIIFPGVISPHVHAIVGGTRFALSETNEQAAGAKATTCDKVLDKSNYWQPQLYHQRNDGRFEMVEMQGIVSLPAKAEHTWVPG